MTSHKASSSAAAAAAASDVTRSAAKLRVSRLLRQLPPHDADWHHCTALTDAVVERTIIEEFTESRRQFALGQGTVYRVTSSIHLSCRQCGDDVVDGEMAVFARRAGTHCAWHIDCFVCSVCRQQLVELIYFYVDGRVYCGRHHAETLRPRCAACDEIIFADYCTSAEGQYWHRHHWNCSECRQSLAGRRYSMTCSPRSSMDSSITRRPVCLDCYNALYADFCVVCGQIIGVNQRHVVDNDHDDRKWHARCFRSVANMLPVTTRCRSRDLDAVSTRNGRTAQ